MIFYGSFFIHLSQALGLINITAPEQIQTFADVLPLDII